MKSFSEIKSLSKQQFKNNWKLPVLFTFITLAFFAISVIWEDQSETISLSISILSGILGIFLTNIILNIVKYNEVKSIKVPIKQFLRIIGSEIVIFIPIFLLILAIILGSVYMGLYFVDNLALIIILCVSAYILSFVIGIYLSFTSYLILEDCKIFESIKYSFLYIKGNFLKTLWLCITFIPWLLLSGITLGLAFLYVGPYLQITYANYYLELKNKYNSKNQKQDEE